MLYKDLVLKIFLIDLVLQLIVVIRFLRNWVSLTLSYQCSLNPLTTNVPIIPSYRNQSVNLQSTSADWFLYNGNIDR